MKTIFKLIGTLLLVTIIAGGVVLFAFEKEIPANFVNKQVEEVSVLSLGKAEKPEDLTSSEIEYYTDTVTYNENDGKIETKTTSKVEIYIKKVTKSESVSFVAKTVNYSNEGKTVTTNNIVYTLKGGKYYKQENDEVETEISEGDWNDLLYTYGFLLNGIYDSGNDYNIDEDLKIMINNNVEKVTQKGLNIYFNMKKDNKTMKVGYNVLKKQISSYELVSDNYLFNNKISTDTVRVIIK